MVQPFIFFKIIYRFYKRKWNLSPPSPPNTDESARVEQIQVTEIGCGVITTPISSLFLSTVNITEIGHPKWIRPTDVTSLAVTELGGWFHFQILNYKQSMLPVTSFCGAQRSDLLAFDLGPNISHTLNLLPMLLMYGSLFTFPLKRL
jgi:hypothetical protein